MLNLFLFVEEKNNYRIAVYFFIKSCHLKIFILIYGIFSVEQNADSTAVNDIKIPQRLKHVVVFAYMF